MIDGDQLDSQENRCNCSSGNRCLGAAEWMLSKEDLEVISPLVDHRYVVQRHEIHIQPWDRCDGRFT